MGTHQKINERKGSTSRRLPLFPDLPNDHEARLSVNWAVLGLTEDPFSPHPDSRYFFLSRIHELNLAELLYGIAQDRRLIVVTGEAGSGKTILCHTLLEQVGRDVRGRIVSGVSLRGKNIKRVFTQSGKGSGRVVLVVDDADALSDNQLALLGRLAAASEGNASMPQIVLVGRPELKERLVDPRYEMLLQYARGGSFLRRLERKEVRGYIRHRLQVASDERSRTRFTGAVVGLVLLFGFGRPRRINRLCGLLLRAACRLKGRPAVGLLARALVRDGEAPSGRRWIPAAATAAVLLLSFLLVSTMHDTSPTAREMPDVAVSTVAEQERDTGQTTEPAVAALAPAPPEWEIDEHDIVRVSEPAESLKGALASLFRLWDMNILADESLTWKIVNFNAGLLDFFLKETRIAGVYGLEMHPRNPDVVTILKIGVPCIFSYRTSFGGSVETRYAVMAGQQEGRVVIYDPLEGRRLVGAQEWEASLAGPVYYLYQGERMFTPLKSGDVGIDVMDLQKQLRRAGIFRGFPDGTFDEQTCLAVESLQKKIGLKATGIADLDTRIALLRSYL